MKKWKSSPLFLLLLISTALMTGAGYAGKDSVYASYSGDGGWLTPALSLVFQGWKDGVYPWELFTGHKEQAWAEDSALQAEQTGTGNGTSVTDTAEALGGESSGGEIPAGGNPGGGNSGGENTGGENAGISGASGTSGDPAGILDDAAVGSGGSGETLSGDSVSSNSADGQQTLTAPEAGQENGQEENKVAWVDGAGLKYDKFGQLISDPDQSEVSGNQILMPDMPGDAASVQQEEAPENGSTEDFPQNTLAEENDTDQTYSFEPVTESYFNDALFIGDSRTVGMDEYGGFQEETTFYAATSLTIYNVFEKPKKVAWLEDGKKATIEEALTERQFGKIYIMLGINELGTGTTESFFTTYAETVNHIRQLQPDAIIFIQGIMRVSGKKSSTDPVFNNPRINERNQALSMMANNQDIFYLEVNDSVCDENGDLIEDYTFDQIHLKAKYYQLWKDYLFAHGIVR